MRHTENFQIVKTIQLLQSQKSHEMTDATAASVTVEARKVGVQPRPGVDLIGCSLGEHRWNT